MSDFSDADEEQDPFSPHNLAISQFILSARIYDVLMALLMEQNREVAKDILELHAGGNLIGPQPSFNGLFITDEANTPQSEEPE